MPNKMTIAWFQAALIRAIKTMAQTALGLITVGSAMNDTNWGRTVSICLVAGAYSMLTSIVTGLPETVTDGVLKVDPSNPEKDVYKFEFNDELENLAKKKTVTFTVDQISDKA